jgi:hypothetical protein
MTSQKGKQHLAWARVNAYGLLFVGLLLMTFTDLLHPGTSNIGKLIGIVPPLLPYWTAGYLLAAFFMLWGFFSSRTWPEIVGLAVLAVAHSLRTIIVAGAAGWHSQTAVTEYITWSLLTGVACLRLSILLSKDGLTISIPGRVKK